MLADDYDMSTFTHEDGVAALHVSAMLLDAHPSAAGHMVSVGAVPMFLSRYLFIYLFFHPRELCGRRGQFVLYIPVGLLRYGVVGSLMDRRCDGMGVDCLRVNHLYTVRCHGSSAQRAWRFF